MKINEKYNITLANFEGPLEFLLYLVQKNEIDLHDIRLHKITEHFINEMRDPEINLAAEFISTLASLLWLKSKLLLPKHEEKIISSHEEEPDPHFDVIHQLIDYCRFKEAGKTLITLEEQQNAFFPRGISGDYNTKIPSGIHHLSLEDLSLIFNEALQKAEANKGKVREEHFLVSDKISFLKRSLKLKSFLCISDIFHKECCKEELIVCFLAILELMKNGELEIVQEKESGKIFLNKKERSNHE